MKKKEKQKNRSNDEEKNKDRRRIKIRSLESCSTFDSIFISVERIFFFLSTDSQ